jgi:hypothetical protein
VTLFREAPDHNCYIHSKIKLLKIKLFIVTLTAFLIGAPVFGQIILGGTLVDPNGNPLLEGKITLIDKTVKEGLVKLPLRHTGNNVGFKKSKSNDTENIDREKVKIIVIRVADGSYNALENLRTDYAYTINTPTLNEK